MSTYNIGHGICGCYIFKLYSPNGHFLWNCSQTNANEHIWWQVNIGSGNVDPDLWRYMASLHHNVLITTSLKANNKYFYFGNISTQRSNRKYTWYAKSKSWMAVSRPRVGGGCSSCFHYPRTSFVVWKNTTSLKEQRELLIYAIVWFMDFNGYRVLMSVTDICVFVCVCIWPLVMGSIFLI